MKHYCEADLQRAFRRMQIPPGSLVMIHSALFCLGRIEGVPITEIPTRLYANLRAWLGPDATLVVPTFNFGFCRGEVFDRQRTPSKGMGSFSEYLRQRPTALRSSHPIQSVAAEGPLAADLTGRDTAGAFEPGSTFDALIDYGAHLLLIGCGVEPISLIHWAEERVGVPYRYWKEFTSSYRDRSSEQSKRTYRMYARDLELNPHVRLNPVARALNRAGQLQRAALGGSTIEACSARDFATVAVQMLENDPTALIEIPRTDDTWSTNAI